MLYGICTCNLLDLSSYKCRLICQSHGSYGIWFFVVEAPPDTSWSATIRSKQKKWPLSTTLMLTGCGKTSPSWEKWMLKNGNLDECGTPKRVNNARFLVTLDWNAPMHWGWLMMVTLSYSILQCISVIFECLAVPSMFHCHAQEMKARFVSGSWQWR